MKFLLRFIITLAVAAGLGVSLYYAVQAFPEDVTRSHQPQPRDSASRDDNRSETHQDQAASNRHESPEREAFRGFRLWTLRKVAGKVLLFSVITAIVVIGHKLVSRKLGSKPIHII